MMSVHKDCGKEIKWAKREDVPDKYFPPLEYVGEVFIIDSSGAAVQVHGYMRHNCDPEEVLAWQDYQQRLAEVKGEQYTPYEAARERDREITWEAALKVECHRCNVEKGTKCRSMQLKHQRTGEIVELRNPHPIRLQLAEERGLA
jgi:hypothetical protein